MAVAVGARDARSAKLFRCFLKAFLMFPQSSLGVTAELFRC